MEVTAKVGLLAMKKKIYLDMSIIGMCVYVHVYVYVCISDPELPITPGLAKSQAQEQIPDFERLVFRFLLQKSLWGDTRYGSLLTFFI